jgi:hypothetical protein
VRCASPGAIVSASDQPVNQHSDLVFHNSEILFFVNADVSLNIQTHFHTVWISVRD